MGSAANADEMNRASPDNPIREHEHLNNIGISFKRIPESGQEFFKFKLHAQPRLQLKGMVAECVFSLPMG
jgi:hypothetical protein